MDERTDGQTDRHSNILGLGATSMLNVQRDLGATQIFGFEAEMLCLISVPSKQVLYCSWDIPIIVGKPQRVIGKECGPRSDAAQGLHYLH